MPAGHTVRCAQSQVPPSEAGSRIAELEDKRKQLTSGGNLKEKHNNWGSVLLGLGVTFSVLGPVNTYLRTGTGRHGRPVICGCRDIM